MEYINSVLPQAATVSLVISFIFYLLQCLFGYKLFRISCAIVGFLIGFFAGLIISGSVFHPEGAWPAIIGVLAGILLAWLAFKLFLVGLFALVFLMVFALIRLFPFPAGNVWNVLSYVIPAVAAVLVAFLAVRFQKLVIITITAVAGGINAVAALNKLTHVIPAEPVYFYWIISAALIAVGFLVQFLMNRSR